jgi:hypothetical protein
MRLRSDDHLSGKPFFGQLPRISDCAGRGTLVAVPVRMTARAKYMLER